MQAMRQAAVGGTMRGPKGGVYRVVNGKKVYGKPKAAPAATPLADKELARKKAEFSQLVRGNPLAAQRALYKQMVAAKGPKEAEEMLRRGLAKVLGH